MGSYQWNVSFTHLQCLFSLYKVNRLFLAVFRLEKGEVAEIQRNTAITASE